MAKSFSVVQNAHAAERGQAPARRLSSFIPMDTKSLKEVVHFYNTRDALPRCKPEIVARR
jgi:hypothetical protein